MFCISSTDLFDEVVVGVRNYVTYFTSEPRTQASRAKRVHDASSIFSLLYNNNLW
jgi:hypothetical protein